MRIYTDLKNNQFRDDQLKIKNRESARQHLIWKSLGSRLDTNLFSIIKRIKINVFSRKHMLIRALPVCGSLIDGNNIVMQMLGVPSISNEQKYILQ